MWLGSGRLYRRDSYGRYRQDRNGGRRPGTPGKWALIALVVITVIVVLASLEQSAYHAVTRGSSYHAVTWRSSR
jgi:hypothetical protein